MGSKKAHYAAIAKILQKAASGDTEVPLFVETFPNAGSSDASLTTVNWKVVTAGGATTSTNNFVSSAVGAGPTEPLNAGYAAGVNTNKGIIYRGLASPTFFFTEKIGVNRSLYNKLKFSAYVGHSSLKFNNFTVRIGTQWYLSSQAYKQVSAVASASDFAANAELYSITVDLSIAQWYLLDYTEGTVYNERFGDAPVVLPAGNIDAVGIRTGEAEGTSRVDGYSITALV